MEWLSASSHKT